MAIVVGPTITESIVESCRVDQVKNIGGVWQILNVGF